MHVPEIAQNYHWRCFNLTSGDAVVFLFFYFRDFHPDKFCARDTVVVTVVPCVYAIFRRSSARNYHGNSQTVPTRRELGIQIRPRPPPPPPCRDYTLLARAVGTTAADR